MKLTAHAGEDRYPAWSPDGSRLEPLIPGTGRNIWPRWSPDGSRLAFFSRAAERDARDDLYILELASGSIHRVTDREAHDFCPAWSPDGARLAAISVEPGGGRWIRLFGLDGSVLGAFAAGMHRITEPSWSPDGRRIAFAARATDSTAYDVFVQTLTVPAGAPARGPGGDDGGRSDPRDQTGLPAAGHRHASHDASGASDAVRFVDDPTIL